MRLGRVAVRENSYPIAPKTLSHYSPLSKNGSRELRRKTRDAGRDTIQRTDCVASLVGFRGSEDSDVQESVENVVRAISEYRLPYRTRHCTNNIS